MKLAILVLGILGLPAVCSAQATPPIYLSNPALITEEFETRLHNFAPARDQGAARLYVLEVDHPSELFQVSILDAQTLARLGNIPFPDHVISDVAVDSEQRRLYVRGHQRLWSGSGPSELWVYDLTQSLPVLAVLPQNPITFGAGASFLYITVNEQTDLVYLWGGGAILVIDPLSNTNPIATIDPGGRVVIDPNHNVVLVGSEGLLRVFEGDPLRGPLNQLVGSFAGPLDSSDRPLYFPRVAVNRRLNQVYVTDFLNRRLLVYDAGEYRMDQEPIAVISVPSLWLDYVRGVAVNPNTNIIYVNTGNGESGDDETPGLTGIDAVTRTVLSHTELPLSFFQLSNALNPVVLDPGTSRVYVFAGEYQYHIIQDTVQATATIVPDGSPLDLRAISISLPVGTTGEVTVQTIDPAALGATAGQFIIEGALAYEISTSPPVSGPINLCFYASSVSDTDLFNALAVIHYVNGEPIEETVTLRDPETGRICATVASLSPFVLARREARYSLQVLHDTGRAFRAGSTAPLKVWLLGSGGENVSSKSILLNAKYLLKLSAAAASGVQDAGQANPDFNFRYDPTLDGYVFNLQTKGLESGTYELRFKAAGDPRLLAIPLQVR